MHATSSRIAVLGLGLIGGSLLRRLGPAATGYDADPATRAAAIDAGHRVENGVADALAGADLVVLAVPLPAMPSALAAVHAAGYRGLVTDVTSVKDEPRRLAAQHAPGCRWVGGHPMAGSEHSGFGAAEPDLFTGCAWVLCLEPGTDAANPADAVHLADWLRVASLVTGLGARVVPATAHEHDLAVARISHAPHIVAAALAESAGESRLALALGAGSFRDGTRVAATRPALTAAMCSGNAAAVAGVLDALVERLTEARALLTDPGSLERWLIPGQLARAQWPPAPGEAETLSATVDGLLALGRSGGWVTAVEPGRAAAVEPGRVTTVEAGRVTAVRP